MLLLKNCPRCHGDLESRSDLAGRYLRCFQCGFAQDLPNKPREAEEEAKVLSGTTN